MVQMSRASGPRLLEEQHFLFICFLTSCLIFCFGVFVLRARVNVCGSSNARMKSNQCRYAEGCSFSEA